MGQEPFGYFGLGRHSGFAKVTRRSGRNPKWPLPQEWICTRYNGVDCDAVFASKPAPTVESLGRQRDRRRLAGRLRRQASSHNWIAGRQRDRRRLAGRLRRQASSHNWIAGRQRDRRRLAGRLRRQASSHNWIAGRQQDSAGWQAVIAGKPAPTIGSRGVSEIGAGWQAVAGASSLATASHDA